MGVAAKKKKMGKHKFPWKIFEETKKTHYPLQLRRSAFAAMR